jgi:intracellular septation protein A
MKILFDFLPIILFFGTFKYAEAHRTGRPTSPRGTSAAWFPAARWAGRRAR